MTARRALAAFGFGVICSAPELAGAAEGGFSFYLPGLVGDIAIAQSTEPGLQVASTVLYQSGERSPHFA